jgi:hypothetical protein
MLPEFSLLICNIGLSDTIELFVDFSGDYRIIKSFISQKSCVDVSGWIPVKSIVLIKLV